MTIQQATDFLSELTLGDKEKTGSLRHLAFVAGENLYNAIKGAQKAEIVSALCEYYLAPGQFARLWNSLSDAERAMASLHIWGDGMEAPNLADDIAEAYHLARRRDQRVFFYASLSFNGLEKFKDLYAEKNSALWLLFPHRDDFGLFYRELLDTVGEMPRAYTRVPGDPAFLSREGRTADFANIVRFCNANKVSVTKGGMLSKASALKMRAFCGYEEIAADCNATPEDARTTAGLLVSFPLSALCLLGGLLSVTEGVCVPSRNVGALIGLPFEQLVKKLFGAYLKNKDFNEISVIKGIVAKRGHRPFEARQNLAAELAYCPVGQWVYTREFERYLRLANRTFARKEAHYVATTGGYEYGDDARWEEYEHPLILILLSFFGALGMVDIVWGDGAKAEAGRRVPTAFRLTALGAYGLGLSTTYAASEAETPKVRGGFTVLPDYTIVVPDSADRIKHELYFENLFSTVSATKEAAVYRLDFATIVRLTNTGGSVKDLRAYLSASDKPLPENVIQALEDWEKQAGRIRLRQVTILECDDEALLEEVIRYKGMGGLVKDRILCAVAVDGHATGEIKKLIEKNKRFCRDVL